MPRVDYDDREGTVTTNTLFSDAQGSVYIARVTYYSNNIAASRKSINNLTPESRAVAAELALDAAQVSDAGAANDSAMTATEKKVIDTMLGNLKKREPFDIDNIYGKRALILWQGKVIFFKERESPEYVEAERILISITHLLSDLEIEYSLNPKYKREDSREEYILGLVIKRPYRPDKREYWSDTHALRDYKNRIINYLSQMMKDDQLAKVPVQVSDAAMRGDEYGAEWWNKEIIRTMLYLLEHPKSFDFHSATLNGIGLWSGLIRGNKEESPQFKQAESIVDQIRGLYTGPSLGLTYLMETFGRGGATEWGIQINFDDPKLHTEENIKNLRRDLIRIVEGLKEDQHVENFGAGTSYPANAAMAAKADATMTKEQKAIDSLLEGVVIVSRYPENFTAKNLKVRINDSDIKYLRNLIIDGGWGFLRRLKDGTFVYIQEEYVDAFKAFLKSKLQTNDGEMAAKQLAIASFLATVEMYKEKPASFKNGYFWVPIFYTSDEKYIFELGPELPKEWEPKLDLPPGDGIPIAGVKREYVDKFIAFLKSKLPASKRSKKARVRNAAMLSTVEKDVILKAVAQDPWHQGGINLDPAMYNLQIKRDGNGIALPVDQQPIDRINISGIRAVIQSITPADLSLMLGITKTSTRFTALEMDH
jgi:hypothetical protein